MRDPDETTFDDLIRDLNEESYVDDLDEALEACADNQEKWATIGAHTVEVPLEDTELSYAIIAAFSAGRLYERENHDS